jgi:hypothetical protein
MRTAPLLLSALALAGCSSLSTSFDYDTAYDFSGLKRYAWVGEEDTSLVGRRIHGAVDEVLARRGYELVQQDAQFLVAAHVSKRDRTQVTDWGYTYSPHGAWYGGGGIDVWQYEEGTLLLDAVDAKTKQMVWRGTASRILEEGWTPEEREEVVREAVEALLEKFPPSR